VSNIISINQKIISFRKKTIFVEGDKSLSIRFILLSALSNGKCTAYNLLKSEDVLCAINSIKKLGIKVNLNNNYCEVFGRGLFGFKYKNGLVLDAGNSGTTARLLCSLLIDTNQTVKITGDKSLKKRDMSRITRPLKMFGANLKDNKGKLPITIKKSKLLNPIVYTEHLGSAQCKSAVMIAALKTSGITKLKCSPSRNHTELMFKNVLKIPIKLNKRKKKDLIQIAGLKDFKPFNYKIPGDISSAAFFIVLTLLSEKKDLIIKNVNINPSRTGIINILNKMGANIKYLNKKKYKGELAADILIKSCKKLKSINLNPKNNSSAIDEFLLIFLVAGKCEGVSTFRNLSELNKKESKRLDWGIKILKMIGIKVKKIKNNGVKIWGKPNLILKKNYVIKDFLKDHRVFMVSVIAALTLGGSWKIHDANESFKTSFPTFLKILKNLGAKIK
jgi:3-phosphoshikimate 1-carboxyvinyltransferase